MFETRGEETGTPSSSIRGRSPGADSVLSGVSSNRPVSKVRASFVSIEKPIMDGLIRSREASMAGQVPKPAEASSKEEKTTVMNGSTSETPHPLKLSDKPRPELESKLTGLSIGSLTLGSPLIELQAPPSDDGILGMMTQAEKQTILRGPAHPIQLNRASSGDNAATIMSAMTGHAPPETESAAALPKAISSPLSFSTIPTAFTPESQNALTEPPKSSSQKASSTKQLGMSKQHKLPSGGPRIPAATTSSSVNPLLKRPLNSTRPHCLGMIPGKVDLKSIRNPRQPIRTAYTAPLPVSSSAVKNQKLSQTPVTGLKSSVKPPRASMSAQFKPMINGLNGPAAHPTTQRSRPSMIPSAQPFHKPKPKSPTRPIELPAHLTQATAASRARTTSSEQRGLQPPSRRASAIASARPSLGPPSMISRGASMRNRPKGNTQPRKESNDAQAMQTHRLSGSSASGTRHDFLERMMRPTDASKRKLSDRHNGVTMAPSSKLPARMLKPPRISSVGMKRVGPGADNISPTSPGVPAGKSLLAMVHSEPIESKAEVARPQEKVAEADHVATPQVEPELHQIQETKPDTSTETDVEPKVRASLSKVPNEVTAHKEEERDSVTEPRASEVTQTSAEPSEKPASDKAEVPADMQPATDSKPQIQPESSTKPQSEAA